ncbi:MAG: hypothetical protein Q8906_09790 [Bacillota bacterium]|nr:hypothetical protein [Bacillota bacterium]
MDVGLVAVILIFSPAVIRTITKHLEKQKTLKHELVKNELELEKLKHANYLLETEKMRLELEKELKLDTVPKIKENKF